MRSSSKRLLCAVLMLLASACTTTDNSVPPALLKSAYLERAINVNSLGQLEPEILNDCPINHYYWEAHGRFDESTLSAHYSIHYTGIVIEVIEDDGDLYISTANSPFTTDNNTLTEFPLLNNTLAASITLETKFIINTKQLKTNDALLALSEMLQKSNNDQNITLIATKEQKQVLSDASLSKRVMLTAIPDSITTTRLDMLSLCQSLNNKLINASYVSDKALLKRLSMDSSINFVELVQTLPHDADFSNLQQQQHLWGTGQYQRFNGQIASIRHEATTYQPVEIDSSEIKRDQQELNSPEIIIFNISQ